MARRSGVHLGDNNKAIGAGTRLVGGIKIGDNEKIGDNPIITGCPDNAAALGVKGKIAKRGIERPAPV